MKVLTFFLFVFCIPILLCCDILEVDIEGNYEYQVIQEAINASTTGDTVLVYPGRYYENLNFNGHNITLASLYINEPLQTYIDSTIIDGNYMGSCIIIENGETAEVNGFTLINNEEGINIPLEDYPDNAGGGIYLDLECNVILKNCIIRNCFSKWGGGLAINRGAYCEINNVNIYNNRALVMGGGLFLGEGIIAFDQSDLCSIYNNTAAMGMDMYFHEYQNPSVIYLAMGSVILTEADYFFITEYDSPNISINCVNSYFSLENNDLYVSPWGDDSNSGLNEGDPLQTIAYAMQIIAPDSLDPKTIHLAEGTYSFSENGQIFPFAVKSDIRLQGAGMENTILDNEFYSSILNVYGQRNIEISDFRITDCQSVWLTATINCKYSEYVSYRNLIIENSYCSGKSGLSIGYSDNNIIENVIIRDAICDDDTAIGVAFHYSENGIINNLIIDNLGMIGDVGSFTGLFLGSPDLMIRNTTISNCSAIDAYLIWYQNTSEGSSDNTLDLTNTLIMNNNITYTDWAFAEVYLQHRYQPMHIANCTIANNHGFGNMMSVFGMAELSNNIIYNPDMNQQLFLNNSINGIDYDVVMRNNLIDENAFNVVSPEHVTYSGNLWNAEPLFAGECYPYLPDDIPLYYQLSVDSPCIDTGTPDTLGLYIPPMDLAGNERVWNDIIDMGCYEYGAPPHIGNTECEIENVKCKISNYPNPVYLKNNRGNVFLEFTLPEIPITDPEINIYNAKGQKVKTIELTQSLSGLARIAGLATTETQRGEAYSTVWDCRNENGKTVSSGVYFYVLSLDGQVLGANKLLILK
ncbi:MAG: right-handed parallel beta-helix repeat-containing protein [Candidatus Cloacimonetes bacterium]|nr:right-handed parallel beta-helix repeat-containing protein [Candidatus Cloacimonadota bacterium]